MKIFTLDHTPILKISTVFDTNERRILGVEIDNLFKPNLVGNIYAGKVIAIADGMEGAFIDIGLKNNAYIQRKELLRALKIVPSKVKETPLSQLVKKGQMILVQLDKAPYQTKGAQVTNEISLTGQHVVFMPYLKGVKISRKISNGNNLEALASAVERFVGSDGGVIIRSAAIAKQVSEAEILSEISELKKQWQDICHTFGLTHTVKCLYTVDAFKSSVIDMIKQHDIDAYFVHEEEDKKWLLSNAVEKSKIQVKQPLTALFHEKGIPLDAYLNGVHFESKSGVSITLNELEAFTIVDVNSNKMNMERKTIFEVNDIASKIVLENILLRNISGIILVDFIEMTLTEKQSFIQHLLLNGFDKVNGVTIHGFTTLGILELTRKREKASLRDLLSVSFEAADLYFWALNELYIELRRIQSHTNTRAVTVEVEEEMYILLRQNQLFTSLELKIAFKNVQNRQKKFKILTSKD